jgi:hypothetical protein
MSDFYTDSARRRLEQIEAERAAARADLAAYRTNSDYDSAAQIIQQLADLDRQAANLHDLWNAHVNANRQPYVSDEQRAARQPHELDAQDLANMMNGSKYRGHGFSADDYYRLRSGLPLYQAARGREQK